MPALMDRSAPSRPEHEKYEHRRPGGQRSEQPDRAERRETEAIVAGNRAQKVARVGDRERGIVDEVGREPADWPRPPGGRSGPSTTWVSTTMRTASSVRTSKTGVPTTSRSCSPVSGWMQP